MLSRHGKAAELTQKPCLAVVLQALELLLDARIGTKLGGLSTLRGSRR